MQSQKDSVTSKKALMHLIGLESMETPSTRIQPGTRQFRRRKEPNIPKPSHASGIDPWVDPGPPGQGPVLRAPCGRGKNPQGGGHTHTHTHTHTHIAQRLANSELKGTLVKQVYPLPS